MNGIRVAVLCLLVVGFATALQASEIPTAIDPVIKVGGLDPPAPAGIITPSFTIVSPSGTSPGTSPCLLYQFGILTSTSPACFFENGINPSGVGEDITKLAFDVPTVDPGTVTCGFLTGSPFANCRVSPLAGGGTEVQFTGGLIPFHTDFFLDFEGFPANTSLGVTATATATPEPASIALFLTVIGSAWLGRRKWRSV